MSQDKRLRINNAECAAKVIDGEAVIINLINGTYYGMDKAGGAMWELLADGHSTTEVTTHIVARYDVDEVRARADIERLIDELVAEKLLIDSDSPLATSIPVVRGTRESYETPELTTYRDMAELLALDPPMPRLENIG